MMYEFFIAKRYLKSKHKINFISIISILSTLGITIGVAALIIVLSVFNGFGSLVKSIFMNFDPHVRITLTSEKGLDNIHEVAGILDRIDEIKSYYPFVEGKAVLINDNSYEVVNLKGINFNYGEDDWGLKNNMFKGSYELPPDDEINRVIIGLPLHVRLFRRLNDTLFITSFNNIEKTLLNFRIPKTYKAVVTGIFETSSREYDANYVFTSLKDGRKFLNLGDRITGYDIRLHDYEDAETVMNSLYGKLDRENFNIETWYDLHKDLYNVMIIERWAAYIILCLIIAVATFNILGSLTMSVIEKKKDIGVLRAMGSTGKSILRIFMFEGILIGIIGTAAGTFIGLLICYLQMEYNFYPLNPAQYIIDAMPVEIRISDIFAIGIMSLLLTFFAALYPARRAVRTPVLDAIKWE